jgi:hypothetical protein
MLDVKINKLPRAPTNAEGGLTRPFQMMIKCRAPAYRNRRASGRHPRQEISGRCGQRKISQPKFRAKTHMPDSHLRSPIALIPKPTAYLTIPIAAPPTPDSSAPSPRDRDRDLASLKIERESTPLTQTTNRSIGLLLKPTR